MIDNAPHPEVKRQDGDWDEILSDLDSLLADDSTSDWDDSLELLPESPRTPPRIDSGPLPLCPSHLLDDEGWLDDVESVGVTLPGSGEVSADALAAEDAWLAGKDESAGSLVVSLYEWKRRRLGPRTGQSWRSGLAGRSTPEDASESLLKESGQAELQASYVRPSSNPPELHTNTSISGPNPDQIIQARFGLSPEELTIALSKRSSKHHTLPQIPIRVYEETDDPVLALVQTIMLDHFGSSTRTRLDSRLLQQLITGKKAGKYRHVLTSLQHIATPRLTKSGRQDYMPGHFMTGQKGKGRATTWLLQKKFQNIHPSNRPTHTLTGKYAARYIRQMHAAVTHLQSRKTELTERLMAKQQFLSFDEAHARATCSGQEDAADWRRTLRSIEAPRYSVGRGGRLYTGLTQIPRSMRPFLRFRGQATTAIDVTQAHPCFLIVHALRHWDLPADEAQALHELFSTDNRAKFGGKHNLTAYLNQYYGKHSYPDIDTYFMLHFPTFYDKFSEERNLRKEKMFEIYEEIETELMEGSIRALEEAGLWDALVGREQDGLRVTHNKQDECLQVVQDYLNEATDYLAKVKVKTADQERAESRASTASTPVTRVPTQPQEQVLNSHISFDPAANPTVVSIFGSTIREKAKKSRPKLRAPTKRQRAG